MIAILDYRAGNLTSVKRAMDALGRPSVITRDPSELLRAERIIFPGVGAAGKAMADLRAFKLDQALQGAFLARKPILGICLGTQIILEHSEENDTDCLGLGRGKVIRFPEPLKDGEGRTLKVPHMGWNRVEFARPHPLFEGIDPGSEFYFVHSYYPVPEQAECILGKTDHGVRFPSVLEAGNLAAVQFHPEKSGRAGLRILENFCSWSGGPHA